ncbi:MAG: TIGR00159 family protein, partial [Chitinophagaceae bacterium]
MKSLDFDFLKITWINVIDILVVAVLLYYIYSLIKNTLAVNLLLGLLIIFLFYHLVSSLHMDLLSTIINKFMGVGIMALVVIFQPEIRRFLLHIGKNT